MDSQRKIWLDKTISIDEAVLYIGKGCDIHPLLCEFVLDTLCEMEKKGKVCLTPLSIFQAYHKKLKKAA